MPGNLLQNSLLVLYVAISSCLPLPVTGEPRLGLDVVQSEAFRSIACAGSEGIVWKRVLSLCGGLVSTEPPDANPPSKHILYHEQTHPTDSNRGVGSRPTSSLFWYKYVKYSPNETESDSFPIHLITTSKLFQWHILGSGVELN